MTGSPSQPYASRVFRAFFFSGAGNLVSRLIQAVALVVVLKFLTPQEFGAASIVIAFYAILQAITDAGLGVALIRESEPEGVDLDSLFWCALGISTAVYLAIWAAAPIAAGFFGEAILRDLLRVHGIILLTAAFGMVSKNLLIKELGFGSLALINAGGNTASGLVMIVLAMGGAGAWAITIGEVTLRGVQVLGYLVRRPYLPRPRFEFERVRSMVTFGAYVTGSRVLYNFYTHADYLVVGRLLGAQAVGVYTVAYRLVFDPLRALIQMVTEVAYPVFSEMQDDVLRLRRYLSTIAAVALVGLGTVLITLAVHVEWILEVFGFDQWLEAVPLVRIMAVIGLLRCVTPLLPQLLNAAGLSRLNFFYSLVCAIVLPVAFVVGARWGLEGVAWSWVVGYPLVVLVLVVFSARVLELRLGETLRLLWGELWLLAGPLAVSLGLLLALGRLFPDPNPVTLVLSMGATLALGLWLVYHRHRETLLTVARRGRSRA